MEAVKLQKITISLMVMHILITLWAVWQISTMPSRKIDKDCGDFVSSWIESNPKLSSDLILKLSKECYEQGGSREWQLSQDVKQIRDDLLDFVSR